MEIKSLADSARAASIHITSTPFSDPNHCLLIENGGIKTRMKKSEQTF